MAAAGTALLVVDVQTAAVALEPWRVGSLLASIQALQAAFRQTGLPVIHVRHDDGPGSSTERGTPGWRIFDAVAPLPGEMIVDKQHNSAFRGTGLHALLQEQGIETLIICGLQTEYCVDTSVRVAFELGYQVTIPDEAHSTYDNGNLTAEQIHTFISRRVWHGRFADVVTTDEALALLRPA